MKKLLIISLFLIPACTAQKPVSQAPVWNITVTDNSQFILGDGNKTESKATTETKQTAEPVAESSAKSIDSQMWILALILLVIAAVGGYFMYKKWIK